MWRKKFKTFKTKGTSSNKGCIGDYQQEGVCIMARGDIVGRISDAGSDSRGLGYCVLQERRTGIKTMYDQQERLLTLQGVKKP
eukprot:15026668-Ditylum_brightwellii.AAC.1